KETNLRLGHGARSAAQEDSLRTSSFSVAVTVAVYRVRPGAAPQHVTNHQRGRSPRSPRAPHPSGSKPAMALSTRAQEINLRFRLGGSSGGGGCDGCAPPG